MDSYNDLLVELLNRVIKLEKEVKELKSTSNQNSVTSEDSSDNTNNNEKKDTEKSTVKISTSKNNVISEIRRQIKEIDSTIEIRKAKRNEGNGLFFSSKNSSTVINAALKISKDHKNLASDPNVIFSGWHQIKHEDINKKKNDNTDASFYDYFIFCLITNIEEGTSIGDPIFLIFDSKELKKLVPQKGVEDDTIHHFYFSTKDEIEYIDARSGIHLGIYADNQEFPKDKPVAYLNDWTPIIEDIKSNIEN